MRDNGIDNAHSDCNARICKRRQGRYLYELEMVSAECRAPSDFKNACFLHQHIIFIIIVEKNVKTKITLARDVDAQKVSRNWETCNWLIWKWYIHDCMMWYTTRQLCLLHTTYFIKLCITKTLNWFYVVFRLIFGFNRCITYVFFISVQRQFKTCKCGTFDLYIYTYAQ